MAINNMNFEGIKNFMEEVKKDYSKAKKSKKIKSYSSANR